MGDNGRASLGSTATPMPQPSTPPTMDILDEQIQVLIQEAPQDGGVGQAVATLAPVLKAIAQTLRHSQYYVLQTLDQGWVMTTLSNRQDPSQRRNLIYAFPTLQDAANGPQSTKDPQLMAIPIPVTHILFQMLALKSLDSLVFFEVSGTYTQGTEVSRPYFQTLIQAHLQAHNPAPPTGDIALG